MADGDKFSSSDIEDIVSASTSETGRAMEGRKKRGRKTIYIDMTPSNESTQIRGVPDWMVQVLDSGKTKSYTFQMFKIGMLMSVTKNLSQDEAHDIFRLWVKEQYSLDWQKDGVLDDGEEYDRYVYKLANSYFQDMMRSSGADY